MSAVHAYGFGRAILLAKSAIDLAENEGLATEPAKNFASRGPHEGHRLAPTEECVMSVTCSGPGGCQATWTGLKIEHCTVCHSTFTSTPAGDAHRIGPHDPKDGERRCLTVAEMHESKRLHVNRRGHWASGGETSTYRPT